MIQKQSITVAYTATVIRAGREVESRHGKNMIVDGGLTSFGTKSLSTVFAHCRFGTSTNPVKRASGAVTFTSSGSGTVTITASAGFFVAGDVNRILKLDTGEEVRLTVYTSGTVMTGTTTATLTQGVAGTVHYVFDSALGAEVAALNASLLPVGTSAFNSSTGVLSMRKTADSPAASTGYTITEIGWKDDSSALTGRALLAGAGLGIVTGDIIRVTLDVAVTINTASVAVSAGVFSGTSRFYGMAASQSNAEGVRGRYLYALTAAPNIAAVNSADASIASRLNASPATTTASNPSTGVFVYTYTFGTTEANGTIAAFIWGPSGNFWVHNLTTPFVKDNTMTVTVALTLTFTRTLTN